MSTGNIQKNSSPSYFTVALEHVKGFVGQAKNKIDSYNKKFQPLYFSECEKRGQQIANLIHYPNASSYISTALKILPLSLLLFTLCCCNAPVTLMVAGGFAAVVILTQTELFTPEGKKLFLLSCASATLLDTVCKVALAASTLAVGSALGYLAVGAVLTTGLYFASTLVEANIQSKPTEAQPNPATT